MNQPLTNQSGHRVSQPTIPLLTLTELRYSGGLLPAFRPIVVEEFGPGRGPGTSARVPRPRFSVGSFSAGGPTLIGATTARHEWIGGHVPTFLTVDAWAACGLSFDSPRRVGAFFEEVETKLRSSILSPDLRIWVGTAPEVFLRALYGPSPWGDDYGCLVISLLDEPRWVTHKLPLGTVVIKSDRFLDPDHVFGPLGRHAAGDWDQLQLVDPVDGELATHLGARVRSYHELPSLGEWTVTVTTDLGRQETWLESSY